MGGRKWDLELGLKETGTDGPMTVTYSARVLRMVDLLRYS